MGKLGLAPLPLVFALALALSGCGSGSETVDTGGPQDGSSASPENEFELGEIIESGFGQASDEYVWVTALVTNLSDHGGQTVTVSFNVLDNEGEVVATGSQVESFNTAGQQLAVGTQVDVGPRVKAASVEPTLLVEELGAFEETDVDLGTFEADSIKVDQYVKDQWHAKFTITNPTDEVLQSPRIGVICHDADGTINGGGSEHPDLVPPSGRVVVDPILITSGKPKDCTAYVAAGM